MTKGPGVVRYREAAERILEQLDWAINYLNRIGKHEIADALARNRDVIRRRLSNPAPAPRS